jgi:phosphoglycolate phosphatase-like HAD superfamily hydrolase
MTCLMLFDLDGTVVDTAHDLIETANKVYSDNAKHNISYEIGREIASDGVEAFLRLRFDKNVDNFDLLTHDFLKIYHQNFLNNPLLFDGMKGVFLELKNKGIKWGIVTNKARCFAERIIKYHELTGECSVLMCGDDNGFKPKPSPDLLLEACRLLDFDMSDVVYVGDGHRDILSAKSVRIKSVLACYGYLKKSDLINEWKSDYLIHSPSELLTLKGLSLNNSLG